MKKCSTSLPVEEIQIKITFRLHLISVRMAIVKKNKITNAGKNLEGKGTFCPLLTGI
jgi:hypothetical protein